MSVQIERIENIRIDFNEKRILTLIGYRRRPEQINDSVLKLIAEEKEKAPHLIHAETLYAILDSSVTNRHPIFDHAEKIALCLCTIGPELENKSADFFKTNDMLRGLILDAIGSEATEQAARFADLQMAKIARKMGLWPSKRFSPGYKNWDLSEQKFIFEIIPAKKIGVTLNASFMMSPRKSVSFGMNFYQDRRFTTRRISS
jgi:hypothetical protein